MPWTKSNVDRHKQGLTDSQKEQWVQIANSVRKKCLEEGGSESECDAKAIRQANGAVSANNLKLHFYSTSEYTPRGESHDGRKYLVVPVTMMVEGVHDGSWGPIYHRASELAKYVEAWNNRPVTLEHPKKDGVLVSANSPEILRQYEVGRIFNTRFEDGLKAEAWIDEQKIIAMSPTALSTIRQGKPIEVSVGVFSDTVVIEGEWNGETYESVAEHYRPDHLALLPEGEGACSWEDGCGIRVNKKGGTMDDLPKVFKDLAREGFTVSPIVNKQGYQQISEALQSKLDTLDKADRAHYLQEVFDDYFVYAVHDRERGSSTLYKRIYSVNANDEIEIGEDPIEVRKKTEYVTMSNGMTRTKFNTNSKGGKMSDNKKTPCCEGKVDALITNQNTQFTAKDKEWLMALEESQIDKLSPVAPKKGEKTDPPQVNKNEVIDEFKESLKTIEDYTALMPEELKVQVNAGVKLQKEQREKLIKGIMDNTKDVWEEDTLNAMDMATLERVAKSIGKPVDYSGQGSPGVNTAGEDEEPPMDSSPDFKRKEDK